MKIKRCYYNNCLLLGKATFDHNLKVGYRVIKGFKPIHSPESHLLLTRDPKILTHVQTGSLNPGNECAVHCYLLDNIWILLHGIVNECILNTERTRMS